MPNIDPPALPTHPAVAVWQHLFVERCDDQARIISAGSELAGAVTRAVRTVHDLKGQIVELERDKDELSSELAAYEMGEDVNDASELADVIYDWHQRDHADPWAVCPHPVCRQTVTGWPDVGARYIAPPMPSPTSRLVVVDGPAL